jgi:hypothetical protein
MKNLVKITLSLVAFLCLSQVVSAQAVNQGAWMLGGTAGFRSESVKDSDVSVTTIDVSPNLGYFIADDLAIGLSLNLSSVSVDGNSSTDFGLGPFIRFYFADAIFAQVGANLGLGDREFTDLELGLGYSWFVDNSVAIEPKLFYRIHGVGDDVVGDFDSSVFGLSIGIQAFVDRVGVE